MLGTWHECPRAPYWAEYAANMPVDSVCSCQGPVQHPPCAHHHTAFCGPVVRVCCDIDSSGYTEKAGKHLQLCTYL